MRIIAFLFVGLIAIASGCSKSDTSPAAVYNGSYSGTFQRMNLPGAPIANITLSLNYPSFTGSSDISHYPAIGKGRFTLKNEALFFTNESPWTADFDWTLILDKAYIDQVKGDSLIFTKSYGNGWVDVYKLKKD
ncbi:hypothetical protein KJS94_00375 [Flavihumibacter rivuli]|uniref:hypothetical protein n=1 Tax=Flavihumibacter rivuli TaxID=2838156 RepID=UPI001BDEF45C|nr:hypothetical protein [Flavihumibacter rivuli]ULQ56650.1 hypothetical protein KJS94_00375 [Flavihumibacter rivuli]